jgi:Holliday junction DNA helicase RuvA
MIGLLSGKVLLASPELVLLDVHGVGYELHVPLSTFYELERAGEGPVRLYVHTHVREDALQLFGFWTLPEKKLFQRLIGVSGIGPRLAQVILSGMSPGDLVAAIAAGDLGRLTRTPGVGKKTAERLVVELRDKIRELAPPLDPAAPPLPPSGDDLVLALVNLGYKAAVAERAVAEARKERPESSFPEQLRDSLKRLSRA